MRQKQQKPVGLSLFYTLRIYGTQTWDYSLYVSLQIDVLFYCFIVFMRLFLFLVLLVCLREILHEHTPALETQEKDFFNLKEAIIKTRFGTTSNLFFINKSFWRRKTQCISVSNLGHNSEC